MEIKQVKPGLYMVTGMGGNSTVRVGNQGIILVDTKNLGDQFYNDLVAKIKTVSDQPIKHVFVTHVHQDHSGNIGKFTAAGVEVIAHEGLKRNLETGGPKGYGLRVGGRETGAAERHLCEATQGDVGKRQRGRL